MRRTPIHPGEILEGELSELGMTSAELARIIEVPAHRITQIINGKRSISADTALRLGQYFGMSPEFWLNLQKIYELDLARQETGDEINLIPRRPQSDKLKMLKGL
jgi:addiction module HigA family antidote